MLPTKLFVTGQNEGHLINRYVNPNGRSEQGGNKWPKAEESTEGKLDEARKRVINNTWSE